MVNDSYFRFDDDNKTKYTFSQSSQDNWVIWRHTAPDIEWKIFVRIVSICQQHWCWIFRINGALSSTPKNLQLPVLSYFSEMMKNGNVVYFPQNKIRFHNGEKYVAIYHDTGRNCILVVIHSTTNFVSNINIPDMIRSHVGTAVGINATNAVIHFTTDRF